MPELLPLGETGEYREGQTSLLKYGEDGAAQNNMSAHSAVAAWSNSPIVLLRACLTAIRTHSLLGYNLDATGLQRVDYSYCPQ
jgi:hypothetical protein